MTELINRSKKKKKRWKIVIVSFLILLILGSVWGWREGRPWFYGVEAYIYAFPMIVMDVTMEVSTNVPTPGQFKAPINQFSVMTHYPDASFRLVPRTGLDTQFATSWTDLDEEPLVLSVPNTNGRYYVIALFDMWSNVFASIGSRTTGNDSANFLIAGPNWKGTTPPNMKVYKAPTRFVWVNGQMLSNGPSDYEVVNALQKQYKLTPLSAWGTAYTPPSQVMINPDIDTKTQVLEQVKKMDAKIFFSRFARLMKDNPPKTEDTPMVEKLKYLGIEPGKDFDITKLDANIARGLERAMMAYSLLEKGVQKLKTKNGWIIIPADFANYGTDYLTRAGIALIGLGGIWPKDILYPTAFMDGNKKILDAKNNYILHLEKDQLPPAKATWSISMYDPDGYYVPNAINRYHLAEWMQMNYNKDGSLDIYIQSESPGIGKEANWLPAPKNGTFNLTTRIFWPEESALNDTWYLPGIDTVK